MLGVLTACSGGSDGDHAARQPLLSTERPAKPLAKLSVPSAYDSTKGWEETLNWVPRPTNSIPVTVAPHSGIVAYMTVASNGYTVHARDASTGATRWTSRAWQSPLAMQYADGAAATEQPPEIPDLTTVEQGGREYIVAYGHGLDGKDDLHHGTEVVRAAVYPADGSGDATAPLHEVSVPVNDGDKDLKVRDGGAGLLITWGEGMTNHTYSASMDMATGRSRSFGSTDELMPECATMGCYGSKVMALTGSGPVVDMSAGGFGVPRVWSSGNVTPRAPRRPAP